MGSIRISTVLMLLFVPAFCSAQKVGYGFFTPYTEYAFSSAPNTCPSVLQYGMDMGVGIHLSERIGIHVGFGAFRSAYSFNNLNRDMKDSFNHEESVCGPKVFAGVDWFVLPHERICPVVSLSIGYRYLISSCHDVPLYDTEGVNKGLYNREDVDKEIIDIRYIPIKDYSWWHENFKSVQHGADGLFVSIKAGADFKIGDFAVNCSLSYQLSQFFDGAFVGDRQERFGYYDTINGVPSYRPWKVPFKDTLRSIVGISVSFVI